MNYQETLNKSYFGIINQGGPSIEEDGHCLYRGPNGRKCAIGQLIPNDQYNLKMDIGYSGVGFKHEVNDVLIKNGYTNLEFLSVLQNCHDESAYEAFDDNKLFFEIFNKRINKLASEYELKVPRTS